MNTSERPIRLVFLLVLGAILSASPLAATAAPAPPPELTALQPGEPLTLDHHVPVNIVFVGYEQGNTARQISVPLYRQVLPTFSVPVIYGAAYYEKDAAGYLSYPMLYRYDYNLTFADEAFEDAFFSFLSDAAEAEELSEAQELYNAQDARTLTVTDNHWIDPMAVERWLAQNAGSMMGVDTTEYTLFLINWYGRPDFKHHVYVRTASVDPDTGVNVCQHDERCRAIAWGGSAELGLAEPHRIWFLDLSAGPDLWSGNWNVDDLELPEPRLLTEQNGIMDYRLPPVWEYGNLSGYRPFISATWDLALATRFVALNLLFTNSPLYPARLPAREYMPDEIEIDINEFQFDASYNAGPTLDPNVVTEKVQALQPYNTFSEDRDPYAPSRRLRQVFDTFVESFSDPDTDSSYGYRDPGAYFSGGYQDLVHYLDDHKQQYLEGEPDYELPVFSFLLPDPAEEYPFIGYAPSMTADYPVPHFAINLYWPELRTLSDRGRTETVVHEVGHHLGLSHPHDGIDVQAGYIYIADDAFYFAWLGDESNSVMSYANIQDGDFGRFDRDNMSRWMTWEHLRLANHLAGRILESPRAPEVYDLLLQADEYAGLALARFHAIGYEEAVENASAASSVLSMAAERIEVVTDPGGSPGTWGTEAMDRSPFLRQLLNELRDQPSSLAPGQLPTSVTPEEILADLE